MRKRSKYRPYRVDRSAWAHAIGMQQQLTDDQITDLCVAVRISIENMRTGHGCDRDWHTLAAAANVSLILCERGVGPEHLPAVQLAQDALIHIHERQQRNGRWAFDGAAYVAITHLVDIHEAQMSGITRDSARAAVLEAHRRVARGEVLNVVPA